MHFVVLGFFLNKAIEKHRARQSYHQKLSEKRIEAYQDVAHVLSTELLYIMRLIEMALQERGYQSGNEEDFEQEFTELYQEFKNSINHNEPNRIKECNVFLSCSPRRPARTP